MKMKKYSLIEIEIRILGEEDILTLSSPDDDDQTDNDVIDGDIFN